ETGWGQTIVLYDDVPGGAGYVRQIRDNIETVLHAAHHVVSCPDCGPETSCYRCLRDYNNQFYHPLLRRGPLLGFLDELLGGCGAAATRVMLMQCPPGRRKRAAEHTPLVRAAQSCRTS